MKSEEEVFAAAAALPPAERAPYLDVACAGEPELLARIDALLRSHEVTHFTGAGTAVPAVAGGPSESESGHFEQAGDRIGRYKLLERIGEGGFGVVWSRRHRMVGASRRWIGGPGSRVLALSIHNRASMKSKGDHRRAPGRSGGVARYSRIAARSAGGSWP